MVKRDHSDNIEDLAVRDAICAMKLADVAVFIIKNYYYKKPELLQIENLQNLIPITNIC